MLIDIIINFNVYDDWKLSEVDICFREKKTDLLLSCFLDVSRHSERNETKFDKVCVIINLEAFDVSLL